MPTQILAAKIYVPPPRPKLVPRPRLIERLNEGLPGKLTLLSAPAGFGKSTLVSAWLAECGRQAAWLSLEGADNDPASFLTYLIAALQTIAPKVGEGLLGVLQTPQPPSIESILTALLTQIAASPHSFILVLDDYHVIDNRSLNQALVFLIEHIPPQMHLVISTREDPPFPLARWRVRGQLNELRAADLRFTAPEAAEFLNHVMGLDLAANDLASLENRTEGWIAGLQLAAISMQGHHDTAGFMASFTGSHRFVLDYLLEEVLQRQSERTQSFLLRTSILDRLCGPLCDAVLCAPSASGQETLQYLERANLFIVPLDGERRWYRYHHLFGDLLRQRLGQSETAGEIRALHVRASQWYEDNGLEVAALHHAGAANDVRRATRLIEGREMPLHFRGAPVPVLNWLRSQPPTVLDAWPSLWTTYASVLLVTGQQSGVEAKLQAAEAAVAAARPGALPDDEMRDVIGRVAAIRATLALASYQADTVIAQSKRALEYLRPDNLAFRTFTIFKLGHAYQIRGDRAAAGEAYSEAISISQTSGNTITTIAATIGLASVQEAQNQLCLADQTYQRALELFGDQPLPLAGTAHLGRARIAYEWNDLGAAQQHRQHSVQLTRDTENTDRAIACDVLLARMELARGDVTGAVAVLAQAAQAALQQKSSPHAPAIVAAQVLTYLRLGNVAAAAHLVQTHALPMSQARVLLAQGDPTAALAALAPYREQMEARDWQDERLKVMVLQAVALHAHGDKDEAVHVLADALALAEPGGFIRLFVDEGEPMAQLLSDAVRRRVMPEYASRLLAACRAEPQDSADTGHRRAAQPGGVLVEPLSQRELEVLRLVARGLSNRQIAYRLVIALSTVKGHNRVIFDKLQVQRRTEAIARARALGLL